MTADPSQYGLLGGRFTADLDWGSATLSGRYGEAVAGSAGQWLQANAAVGTGGRLGSAGVRALVSGFGLSYLDPFSYDAGGIEVRPAISHFVGRFHLSVQPRLSWGRWTADALEGELRVAGGEAEIQRPLGAVSAVVSAGAYDVENGVSAGTFFRTSGDLLLDRGRWTAGLQLEAQRSPEETELGGGLRAAWTAAPGVEINGYAGRRVRDLLFGTAGSFAVSVSAAIRAVHWQPAPRPAVAAIGEAREGGRVVRFALRAPGAETVALTGDFTAWDPIPMERGEDGWWFVREILPPGLHHFGFIVDEEWAIPPDAPGVVEDGWGRRNASVVVEP